MMSGCYFHHCNEITDHWHHQIQKLNPMSLGQCVPYPSSHQNCCFIERSWFIMVSQCTSREILSKPFCHQCVFFLLLFPNAMFQKKKKKTSEISLHRLRDQTVQVICFQKKKVSYYTVATSIFYLNQTKTKVISNLRPSWNVSVTWGSWSPPLTSCQHVYFIKCPFFRCQENAVISMKQMCECNVMVLKLI